MQHPMILVWLNSRRPAPKMGPHPKPLSLRLMELADELQPKLSEWEYKQLADLAQERYEREKRKHNQAT